MLLDSALLLPVLNKLTSVLERVDSSISSLNQTIKAITTRNVAETHKIGQALKDVVSDVC